MLQTTMVDDNGEEQLRRLNPKATLVLVNQVNTTVIKKQNLVTLENVPTIVRATTVAAGSQSQSKSSE
jgi:hypothetical protein